LIVLLVLVISQELFAFGSREKEGEAVKEGRLQEESRSISLVLVASDPADQGSLGKYLAGEAALFLFQKYSLSSRAIKITSQRRFSMPVESRKKIDLAGIPLAVEYKIELVPSTVLSYRRVKEFEVVFPAKELIASGRVRLQPGRKALLEAAADAGLESGLIRIKNMDYNRKGDITCLVEIARRAD